MESLDNSGESLLDFLRNNKSQQSEQNTNNNLNQDNIYLEKEILLNYNTEHENLIRMANFGINRNTCGPYEFGVVFNAKYFMNIIREYYLRLNCDRINFTVNDKIIYIFGKVNRTMIYTKINTHYIKSDLVSITEGHSKSIKTNFQIDNLLKNLEFHNFTNKESLKMYFVQNKKFRHQNKKNSFYNNISNPFQEMYNNEKRFESEFDLDQEGIPGNIIIETNSFKSNIESIFAPPEKCKVPNIPDAIYSDFILSISLDNLKFSLQRMNSSTPMVIYCNEYLCNFIQNEIAEIFFTSDDQEEIKFSRENALGFCKKNSKEVDESNLFLYMFNFPIKKIELDALRIINKKTTVINFYAKKNEKYYFTTEKDQDNNVTSAIILCSEIKRPLICNIEDCCLYEEHWVEWIDYMSNNLPKECIEQMEKRRKLKKGKDNDNDDVILNASTNNKKKRRQAKKQSNNSKINVIKNYENNDEDKENNNENELRGLNLYANDKDGSLKPISAEEKIRDIGRDETKNEIQNEENEENIIKNPFL